MDYMQLQKALYKYGFYLETCHAWFEEPHPDTYVLLGAKGRNVLTAKTLKPIQEFLERETEPTRINKYAATNQLTIL